MTCPIKPKITQVFKTWRVTCMGNKGGSQSVFETEVRAAVQAYAEQQGRIQVSKLNGIPLDEVTVKGSREVSE